MESSQTQGLPERKKSLETKNFDVVFLAEKIKKILASNKEAVGVTGEPIVSAGDVEINLRIQIEIEGKMLGFNRKSTVQIKTIFENRENTIAVKDSGIKKDRKIVGTLEAEKWQGFLREIPEKLKAEIETEENKEIKKMEIREGKLKVTFAASIPNEYYSEDRLVWKRFPDGHEETYGKGGEIINRYNEEGDLPIPKNTATETTEPEENVTAVLRAPEPAPLPAVPEHKTVIPVVTELEISIPPPETPTDPLGEIEVGDMLSYGNKTLRIIALPDEENRENYVYKLTSNGVEEEEPYRTPKTKMEDRIRSREIRKEIKPMPEAENDYSKDQDRVRRIKRPEPMPESEDTAPTGRITPQPAEWLKDPKTDNLPPLFTPAEVEDLTKLSKKEAAGKIADKLEVVGEKTMVLAKLRETIETATRRLTEIEIELAEIRAEKKETQRTGEKIPETKTFSRDFIGNKIIEILKTIKAVKNIKKLTIEGKGNELILDAEITGQSWGISSDIILKNARLINLMVKGTVGLARDYSLTATTAEKKVKSIFTEHIDSIGEKIREFIEKEEKKTVKDMEIINGELKVTFK